MVLSDSILIQQTDSSTRLNQRLLLEASPSPSASNDDEDDPISQFIPIPDSIQESTVLRRLREIVNSKSKQQRQHDSPSSSPSTSTSNSSCSTYSLSTPPPSTDGFNTSANSDAEETQLTWKGSTLVWTRNEELIRTFTFQENVNWAGWAWFENHAQQNEEIQFNRSSKASKGSSKCKVVEREDGIHQKDDRTNQVNPSDKDINSNSKSKQSSSNSNLDSIPPFTPAQSQMQPPSHSNPSSISTLNPFSKPHSSTDSNNPLTLTLVIFLKSSLILHNPKEGNLHFLDVPFPLDKSQVMKSPSGIGILLVREPEADDRKWIEWLEKKERSEKSKRKPSNRFNSQSESPPHSQRFADLSLDASMMEFERKLIQRDVDAQLERYDEEEEEGGEVQLERPSSLTFYLRRPLDEFNGLFSYKNISFSKDQVMSGFGKEYLNEPKAILHEELGPFADVDERLIPVTNLNEDLNPYYDERRTPKILITANHRTKKIKIYNYIDSASKIQSSGSLRKDQNQNLPQQNRDALMEIQEDKEFNTDPIHSGTNEDYFLTGGGSSQVQIQPTEGQIDLGYDSQLPSSMPIDLDSQPEDPESRYGSLVGSSTPGQNLGRGRPPPRKSARLDRDRRSSGIGSSSMVGGPNSSSSLIQNLGGRDASGRSRRLSSMHERNRLSNNRNATIEPTGNNRTTPAFENDFNLLSSGITSGRPDDLAVQQLAEDLVRHRQSQGSNQMQIDDNQLMMRGPSGSGGQNHHNNRARRTSLVGGLNGPSARSRISTGGNRQSIGPSTTGGRSVSQSQTAVNATPGNVTRPRFSHASSYRSDGGMEVDREISRVGDRGVSMSLGPNGLPIPTGSNTVLGFEEDGEMDGKPTKEEELEKEEQDLLEMELLQEMQSYSQTFAAVSLLEEIDCKDLVE